MSNLQYFNTFEIIRKKFQTFGVLYINDISNKSDFMFSDWNLDIIRPKNENIKTEELISYLSKKFQVLENLGQDYFFITTFFDDELNSNFSLKFSEKSNLELLAPVYVNFEVSKQNFTLNKFYSNDLFRTIENSFSKVSCFELSFGKSIENADSSAYSKQKVFEETLIFANLAITKKINTT